MSENVVGEGEKRRTLTITARGAPTRRYVKSMTVNGRKVDVPIVRHEDIAEGGEVVFEMSDQVEEWGNGLLVCLVLFLCSGTDSVPSSCRRNRKVCRPSQEVIGTTTRNT